MYTPYFSVAYVVSSFAKEFDNPPMYGLDAML